MDILILCAGKGSRMKSDIPKCLHLFHGKEFILHLLEKCQYLDYKTIYIMINPEYYNSFAQVITTHHNIHFLYQYEALGTGHAVQSFFYQVERYSSQLLILNGDMPNLNIEVLQNFIQSKSNLIISKLLNPKGYGRVKCINKHKIQIIEDKDNTEINNMCNMGVYLFSTKHLSQIILNLTNENQQKEYYLTQVFDFMDKCKCYEVDSIHQKFFYGVNTITELKNLEKMI
jgi:bifunctional UDP-N-acetylglucosamine pyrophosphorylase/glucosamine-1-phosphate N-acetyltransferase